MYCVDYCSLDDEVWDVRLHFQGRDNLERNICRSDITYLNLIELIETEGYDMNDSMFYIKEKGHGMAGMELIDGMEKVDEMVEKYEQEKCISITVIKGKTGLPADINQKSVEELKAISEIGEPIVYSIDDDGVLFPSQDSAHLDENDSEAEYLYTQQSSNFKNAKQMEKGKSVCVPDSENDVDVGSEGDSDVDLDVDSDEEMEYEEHDLSQKLIDMKRKRSDPAVHCEGDTEDEDIFAASENEEDDVTEPECVPVKRKKLPVRKGPTERSHCSQQIITPADYLPSDDEQDTEFNAEDDDGFELMSWVQPKGRKSRAKKKEKRIWYDENRQEPQDQFCLKMCFKDVYQFRAAVENLHVTQLRNYRNHRNCKDRVMVVCSEEEKGCPFFMIGSEIKGEKTFCLRKMSLKHTCGTAGEDCKVTAKWLAKVCEPSIRIDPRTGVQTVIESTKEKFGVDVSKDMAYRAKRKALNRVLGDQVKQYRRIRDYLQTVIDTNPGSRCVVTTKMVLEHPSVNPRFHALFMCLQGSKEGFLNGCRPFIGKAVCFTY